MGGTLILASLIIPTLLWCDLSEPVCLGFAICHHRALASLGSWTTTESCGSRKKVCRAR